MALNVGVDDAVEPSTEEAPVDASSDDSLDDLLGSEAPKTDAPPAKEEVPAPPSLDDEDEEKNVGSAGRVKKESIAYNKKALSESRDPDALLMTEFRKALKKTTPIKAAKYVAESYGIRVGDLVEIINDKANR